MLRRLAILTALAAACLVPAAEAAAPLHELTDLPARGTAIVSFTGKRAAFVRVLRRAGLAGRSVVMRKLPLAAVSGPRALLEEAARLGKVRHVERNHRLEYHLHDSAPIVFGGAARRTATYTAGFDGTGVNVAVIDTGLDGTHPDFADHVVRNVKVVGSAPGPVQYVECPAGLPCSTDTTGGHGTHVAGIVAGDGTASDGFHTGVAPGAGVVALGVGEAVAVLTAVEAMDYILAHPELHVVAVNNSYGEESKLFDETEAINVATKKLTDAGISVVFSAGNAGVGPRTDPEGASDCSVADGGADCKMNAYGVAPWVISVANARKDAASPAAQPLAYSSSRGDDRPQKSATGKLDVLYQPTLSAPGTNIYSARTLTGVAGLTCGNSAEAPSCLQYPDTLAYYVPISGTSMAAPHVTGAIAVLQSAAKARLGRLLTPAEVKALLTRTATPMTAKDGLWDFPCGLDETFLVACGAKTTGTTGLPYAPWQDGAGIVDVAAAIAALPAAPASPTPTPTPTVSATVTPTVTATATPSPTPTPTSTPTPEPTPDRTPKPVGSVPDFTPPHLSDVSVRREGIRLTLSEDAQLHIIIKRRRPRRRFFRIASVTRALPEGTSRIVLGPLHHTGRLKVILVATDAAGNASRPLVGRLA